ncbi:CASP-like protein 4D1 [Ricinus communis]|uniref:CASP-like protein 4D1 n=1 Tax=Ricinus communis TaxID=3988 RepID=UPI00201B0E34|nr:CASP-like protein 4D1 [Ricinus communis]
MPLKSSVLSNASRKAPLVLRVLTFIFLLASLIILISDTASLVVKLDEVNFHFKDVISYRFMLATIVIGMAYTIMQVVFRIYHATTGKSVLSGDGNLLFEMYGDKVISYILATGVPAGFGVSVDLKPIFEDLGAGEVVAFFDKGYASAGLLLIGFLCMAISSVCVSYTLPNYVDVAQSSVNV